MHARDKVLEGVEITVVVRDQIVGQTQISELVKVSNTLRGSIHNLVELVAVTLRRADFESVLTRERNANSSRRHTSLSDQGLRIRVARLISSHLQTGKVKGDAVVREHLCERQIGIHLICIVVTCSAFSSMAMVTREDTVSSQSDVNSEKEQSEPV